MSYKQLFPVIIFLWSSLELTKQTRSSYSWWGGGGSLFLVCPWILQDQAYSGASTVLRGVNNRTTILNLLSPWFFPSSAPGSDTVPAVSASGHAASGGGSAAGGSTRSAPRSQGPVEKDEGGNQKRARRQWESWSTEDKNSFFEGLYEVICYFPGCCFRSFNPQEVIADHYLLHHVSPCCVNSINKPLTL